MERLLVILAAVFMMFSFSMVGLARETNVIGYAYYPDTMIGTGGTSQQATMDGQTTCGLGEVYTGVIAWTNKDTHTIMVRGEDGSKIFDVSKATIKGIPETDQFVTVKYSVMDGDKIASSVRRIPEKVASLYVYNY